MINDIEIEFNDLAGCYKYELMNKKLLEYYAGTVAPLHISEYPEFIQRDILDRAQTLAERYLDHLKATDLHRLQELAEKTWKEEVIRLEKLAETEGK